MLLVEKALGVWEVEDTKKGRTRTVKLLRPWRLTSA